MLLPLLLLLRWTDWEVNGKWQHDMNIISCWGPGFLGGLKCDKYMEYYGIILNKMFPSGSCLCTSASIIFPVDCRSNLSSISHSVLPGIVQPPPLLGQVLRIQKPPARRFKLFVQPGLLPKLDLSLSSALAFRSLLSPESHASWNPQSDNHP